MTFAGDISYYLFLQRRLSDVFTYVSCHRDNFGTHSIQIKSLLLDICSFWESLSQRFIRELAGQGLQFSSTAEVTRFTDKVAGKDDFNAGDYRLLLEGEFKFSAKEVNLNVYEDNLFVNPLSFAPDQITGYKLCPYQEWAKGTRTHWWEAFTNLKHDPVSKLPQATLGNTIDALAATYILLTIHYEKEFKEGRVDAELYEFFLPKYWIWNGRIMPGVFTWK